MFISLINNIFSFLLRLLNNNCKDIVLNLTFRNAHMIMLRYMMERQQKRRHWDFSVAIGSHIPQSHRRTRCTLSLNRMARFREAGSQQTIPPVSRNPLLAYISYIVLTSTSNYTVEQPMSTPMHAKCAKLLYVARCETKNLQETG